MPTFGAVSCLRFQGIFLTSTKTGAATWSNTSVRTFQATRCQIPQDWIPHHLPLILSFPYFFLVVPFLCFLLFAFSILFLLCSIFPYCTPTFHPDGHQHSSCWHSPFNDVVPVTVLLARWPSSRASISDTSNWLLSPQKPPDPIWGQLGRIFVWVLGDSLPRVREAVPESDVQLHLEASLRISGSIPLLPL